MSIFDEYRAFKRNMVFKVIRMESMKNIICTNEKYEETFHGT